MSPAPRHVLVTGATGYVGAHIVDLLLERGIKVTGTARSPSKANEMKTAREQYRDLFSMTITGDLTAPGTFDTAVQDVDVIIHVASPVPQGTVIPNPEQDIVLPAIRGVQSILKSAEKSPLVKRVVLTSSFGAVADKSRDISKPYTYTSEDWNPATYEEAVSAFDPVFTYRASKKLAELEAWNWVRSPSSVNAKGEKIDLVVFCPPFVYGPWVHPVDNLSSLNTSIQAHRDMVLGITTKSLAVHRSSHWVDVRDVALAHVEAVYIRPDTSNKRFIVCSPEKSSFQQEAEIIKEAFPEWAQRLIIPPSGPPRAHITLDGSPLTRELGIKYTSLRECMIALAKQVRDQAVNEGVLAS